MSSSTSFLAARPVWPVGREREMNLFVGFRAVVGRSAAKTFLRLTASSLYRATVNGVFLGHGPARAAHGYFRVDEWDLTPHLTREKNIVAVEVAGYNINSYYLVDLPAFLQAEIVADGKVLAATGKDFEAIILPHRVQKVQRYSAQRTFSEVYRLSPGWNRWQIEAEMVAGERVEVSSQEIKLLPRRVPYPHLDLHLPKHDVARGSLTRQTPTEPLWRDRCLKNIGTAYKGYAEPEIETLPSLEIQAIVPASHHAIDQPHDPKRIIDLNADTYHTLDLGRNLTGFLGLRVVCAQPTRLWLVFDELITAAGDVDFRRLLCVNIVALELQPGTYDFESFEPYTLRYLKLMALGGACRVSNVYMRKLEHPHADRTAFKSGDAALDRIFDAGRSTLAQNAVDIYMDCPSRERAGWLCDSFFIARAEFALTGQSVVERNFLENYLLANNFGPLPDGMWPKCYPADHPGRSFLPNWPMWGVLELEEYLQRSGDRAMIDAFEPRVAALLRCFEPYLNEHGLIENAPGSIFIEWSKANLFTDGLNFPFNMTYAATLDAAARLYQRDDWRNQAATVREAIRKLSFDGQFFIDQALRTDGKLSNTRNRTEVCQYLAFYMGVADPTSHPALWRTLCKDFGPQRKDTRAHPDIHPANAFIGNYLRLELLSRYGRVEQAIDETRGYFLFMAERTGTLWEFDSPENSCCHGFAAHVCYSLLRDLPNAG